MTWTVLAGSFCGLLFGYDIGAMAGAAPGIRTSFRLSPGALGLAVSAALFGTIVGSVAAGFLADALGRRVTLSLSGLLYALAVGRAATAGGLAPFATSRFVCGIAIGLISVAAPLYLAEIAPSRRRGRIVGSFQLSLSIGVVAAFLAGYLLSLRVDADAAWRFLLGGAAIPALLCELCLLRSPESPRWLAIKGRFHDARRSLEALGFDETEFASVASAAASTQAWRRVALFSREHMRSIVLAVTIAVFNQLTGVNALLYYILDVFRDLGSGRLNGRADAVTLASLSLVVTIVAVLVIDKIGRKPLLLAGCAGMCICLFALPAIRRNGWPPLTVVVVLACYDACFGFSQGAVIWVYLSEIFALPVRARGQSLGSTVHWITNALVVGTFPAITSRLGEGVFAGLAFLMGLQFLTILLFYPETKGRTLESLAAGLDP